MKQKVDNIAAAASPLLTTVGFGVLVGFLIGFFIKKLFKILAIIAGIFLAALMYLETKGILNINWDKLQNMSQGVLSIVVSTVSSCKLSCFLSFTIITFSHTHGPLARA